MRENRKKIARLGLSRAVLLALVLSLAGGIQVLAQQAQPAPGNPQQPAGDVQQPQPAGAPNPDSQNGQQPAQQLPPDTVRPNYVLGPNDQVLIRAPEAEEIDN